MTSFHSNHWPISHRFQDKRQFQSKIANFPTSRVFNIPAELGIPTQKVKETDGATRWLKKLQDTFSRLDTNTGVWRTVASQTRFDGKDRTMQSIAPVSIGLLPGLFQIKPVLLQCSLIKKEAIEFLDD